MLVEDFLVVLSCCQFWVARSKESLSAFYVVVGPLGRGWGDECAANELSTFVAAGAAAIGRGRATHQLRQQGQDVFDVTKGYRGQDIQ